MNTKPHAPHAPHARHNLIRPSLAGMLAVALLGPHAAAQCDPGWIETPGFGFAGTDGTVIASVRWDPDGPGPEPELLVIGGMFTAVETTAANALAAWDGTSWTNLGGGVTEGSIFDRVSSLEVYDGKLIVGGHFGAAGEVPVSNIAAWDGTIWTPLGGGIFGGFAEPEVSAMAVYDGSLIVGGAFTQTGDGPANFVASWDGTTWSALGSGVSFAVMALEAYEGDLYIGGQFNSAGNQPQTSHIAKWDGTNWSSVGGGANHFVRALYSHNGTLYAGGSFPAVGNIQVNQIAAWDGANWSALDTGVFGRVFSLGSFDGQLHAGGLFATAGGMTANNIARWDGVNWHALGLGTNNTVQTITSYGTRLFAGGRFQSAGEQFARSAALWDSSDWAGFPGRPLNIQPRGLEVFEGDLIATGYADLGNGGRDSAVLRFDGLEWTPIGSTMNELAWDIGVHNNQLHAIGWFTTADGNPANGIARWDGTQWTGIGTGFAGGFVTSALSMTTFDNDLIVGGDFTNAGGNPANNIARWDGTSWTPLGDGLTGGLRFVWDVLSYQNDLIAIGEFTTADNAPANGAARWDGTQWLPLGTGFSVSGGFLSGAKAAVLFEGDLVVGGTFTHAGGVPAANIARWDGTSWASLGDGFPDHGVESLAVYNGQLVAGGQFVFNDQSNTRIVRWTGTEWETIGGGVNGGVGDLAIFNSELILAGSFSVAGTTVAPGLARWSDTNTPWFAQQPSDAEACFGETRQLHAALALGYESATLQWRRNGEPLTDGPTGYGSTLSGTNTGTLTITDIHAPDDAIYVCLAQSDCDSVPSDEARLTLCIADYNCDGSVNTLDVLAYLNDWSTGNTHADIDGDGEINTIDVLAFLNAWNAGC